MTTVRVYTHPSCLSCKDVLDRARELEEEREGIDVSLVSLATENGRDRAQERGILVVPAVEVADEVVQEALSKEELEELVDRATAG